MRKFKPAPLLEKVLIEDYAAEGKALARVDGKVIFVEGAVPGDIVDIQLQKNKADWAEGFVKHFHSYSSIVVSPFSAAAFMALNSEKGINFSVAKVYSTLFL